MPRAVEEAQAGLAFFDMEDIHSRVLAGDAGNFLPIPSKEDAHHDPVDAAMANDERRLSPVLVHQLPEKRGEALFEVCRAFPSSRRGAELVLLAGSKLFRVLFLDLLEGEALPAAPIHLIECFFRNNLDMRVVAGNCLAGFSCALELAGIDGIKMFLCEALAEQCCLPPPFFGERLV